jgi:hypothetical protein
MPINRFLTTTPETKSSTEDLTEPLKVILKGVKTKVVPVESRTKGTMILRCGGCFYKVLKLRSSGDNNHLFECKDLNTKKASSPVPNAWLD